MAEPDMQLIQLLAEAKQILVFTGAGISTSSGIGDYRGPQGIWKVKQPVMFNDFMSSHEARVEYWDQKLETWPQIRDAEPNPTHHAIARLEAAGKMLLLATQNIDGLHEKAGTTRERLVELHGTNLKVECMSCHSMIEPEAHFQAFAETRQPPICESCGGYLKPATISFGQSLRDTDTHRAFAAARETDLVLALGSSLSVQPASLIPLMAAQGGAAYVIINRGRTEHDGRPEVTLRLEGDVTDILPAAVDAALA